MKGGYTMTYKEAIDKAHSVRTYAEAESLCKTIEEEYDTISDRQYYNVRMVALNAAFKTE